MPDEFDLAREFAVFASYLGSPDAGGDAAAHYAGAHATLPAGGDRLDRWLLAFARTGSIGCSLAEAYARRARPYGLLRRKLVLALAVLESGRGTHARYDEARPASIPLTLAALAVSGAWWVARTVLAALLFVPLHLAATLSPRRRHG